MSKEANIKGIYDKKDMLSESNPLKYIFFLHIDHITKAWFLSIGQQDITLPQIFWNSLYLFDSTCLWIFWIKNRYGFNEGICFVSNKNHTNRKS